MATPSMATTYYGHTYSYYGHTYSYSTIGHTHHELSEAPLLTMDGHYYYGHYCTTATTYYGDYCTTATAHYGWPLLTTGAVFAAAAGSGQLART
eukprot:scaffold89135_cov72-Phaeocystis_antarctica.AAC.1